MVIQRGRISNANYDGYSRYCGPATLSAITGKGTAEICRSLRKMFALDAIKGMTNYQMLEYLKAAGYSVELVYRAVGGSAAGWAGRVIVAPSGLPMNFKKWHEENARGRDVYLVEVTGHYVALHNGQMVCTLNGGMLRSVANCRSYRKQVKRVWRVS